MTEQVSVVVPFYKELDLVGRAIDSVVGQEVPQGVGIEVIIGNDSEYSEEQIRKSLSPAANAITKVARNSLARGAGNARNAALSESRGGYIAFLDADDYWLPGKVLRQIELVRSGATFVPCAYRFEGKDFRIVPPVAVSTTVGMLSGTVGTSTIMLARTLLGADRFENLPFSQDLDLWARLAAKKEFRYTRVAEEMTVYCPSARTARKLRQFFRFRNVVLRFNLGALTRLVVYGRFAVRGIGNHYVRRMLARRM